LEWGNYAKKWSDKGRDSIPAFRIKTKNANIYRLESRVIFVSQGAIKMRMT